MTASVRLPRRAARRLRLERLEDRSLPAVTITVDASLDRHAINPLIYGTAFASTGQLLDLNAPLNRSGGNAETRYNWQANASNRASDWYFESLPDSSATPGATADQFISDTRAGGAQPSITIPTIGWVAKLGANRTRLASYTRTAYPNQTGYDPYWSEAGSGSTAAGPITDNVANVANQPATPAFQQGWIQHLVSTWGASAAGGVRYYTLDNEPSIWHSTHRDVHPTGATMAEIRDDVINYAAMIRSVDPNAVVIGPEEWGWSGYFYSGYDQQWGSNHGWSNLPDRAANGNMDYLPWVLNQLHSYDASHGTKSLDVFSVHYYPQSGEYGNDTSQTMQLLRNRSTRSLWDPTYVDQSWIGSAGPDGGIVKLIPRLKNWVNTYYPGLQTGITEYNWGAEGHMNGATTQADILGIFGREGLDLANRWTTPATNSPTYLAMKMYRNYDGAKDTFGQTNVRAIAPNPDQVSAFAALRADGALTVMVINKNLYNSSNPGATTQITVNLGNFAHGTAAQLWQLAATNAAQTTAAISHLADVTFSADSLTFNAPMQSVSLFVISPRATATTLFSSVNPSAFGDAVTFTANVGGSGTSAIGGTVTFKDGTTTLGTVNLTNGSATFMTSTLAAGTHTVTAAYSGATGYAPSTSAPWSQSVVVRPGVSSVVIDDGTAQRSVVRSLTVTFSSLVTLDPTAFTLRRADGATVTPAVMPSTVNGHTVARLTFGGANTESGSLTDGNWTLTVAAGQVHDAGSPSITMAADTTTAFHRLFGDVDGDKDVDLLDLNTLVPALFGVAGQPNYNPAFDFDGDGDVDLLDLNQFVPRLFVTLP
ncbi:MAG TPA: glycoside hydrolase family 44 protein [Gemmataceae bacterium]|jgi:hypothetical protein